MLRNKNKTPSAKEVKTENWRPILEIRILKPYNQKIDPNTDLFQVKGKEFKC